MITIVPYDPHWPEEFAQVEQELRQALGELALSIDHIGSTAVPGLVAKDVIDVQVAVASFAEEVRVRLQALGYEWRPLITEDHVPPDVAYEAGEWSKWFFRGPSSRRAIHLHVRIMGRSNQRYALLFRDYLREHPSSASAYGLIKQQLARHHAEDLDAYYDIKDPVCDLIWQAALAWKSHSTCVAE